MNGAAVDVVVIGAGLAGLAAANRCIEHKLGVTLIERGEEERYPCNSRFALGYFHVAMQEIRSGNVALRRAIDAVTRGAADPALATVLADNAQSALHWLRAQGVKMIRGGFDPSQRIMLTPPAPRRPGLHWQNRGADLMVRRLGERFETRGGRLVRATRARELIMEPGRPIGVGAERGGQRLRFDARCVLIADGGFQADQELLRRFVSKSPERLLQRNARTGSGDGVRMAAVAGGLLIGMDRFYGHVQSRDAMVKPGLWPYPIIDLPLTAGIVVNGRGARFADEGLGGIAMANAIARLDDPLEAVAIFDHATWLGRAREYITPCNPYLVKAGGTVHRSGTIEGIAAAAGLPQEALATTVGVFNQCFERGELARLDPPRTPGAYAPQPIRTAPFYAVPLCAGITYTMGGIAIDRQCRVQRVNGGVIEGLYAAGSATGGHEGGPVSGYTGGLAKALVFGLRAADSMAERLRAMAAA